MPTKLIQVIQKLSERVKTLEIQELIDWTHTVSKPSIHDKVHKAVKEQF